MVIGFLLRIPYILDSILSQLVTSLWISEEYIFMQNNDSKYKAGKTMKLLVDKDIKLLERRLQ